VLRAKTLEIRCFVKLLFKKLLCKVTAMKITNYFCCESNLSCAITKLTPFSISKDEWQILVSHSLCVLQYIPKSMPLADRMMNSKKSTLSHNSSYAGPRASSN